MRKDRQFTDPAVPSEEGARNREVENNGKKEKKTVVPLKAETADSSVFEVKIGFGPTPVKARLIKAEPETEKLIEVEAEGEAAQVEKKSFWQVVKSHIRRLTIEILNLLLNHDWIFWSIRRITTMRWPTLIQIG